MHPRDSDEASELIRRQLRAAGLMPYPDPPTSGKLVAPDAIAGDGARRRSMARLLAGFLLQGVLLAALGTAAFMLSR